VREREEDGQARWRKEAMREGGDEPNGGLEDEIMENSQRQHSVGF